MDKPPSPTQIRSHKIPVQKVKHIQPARRRIENKRKQNPRHHIQQSLPDPHPQTPLPHPSKITTPNRQTTTTTRKWATFTYVGRDTTFITKLFKKTDLKIALRTSNNIQGLLMNKKQITDKSEKYTQCGVYKLICPVCNKAYVGQTGRSFLARFNENKAAFKTNGHTSNFKKHLIEQTHSFGSVHDTVQILQLHNKGAHLDTIERYYIYEEFTKNIHLNDEHAISPNKVFETLLKPDQP